MRFIFVCFMLVSCGGETVLVPVESSGNPNQNSGNYPKPDVGPVDPGFPEPLPGTVEDEGQALYLKKCAPCHGKNPDIVGKNTAQIKEALRTVRQMFNVKASSAEQQKIGIFLTDLARGNGQGQGPGPGGGGDNDDGWEDD